MKFLIELLFKTIIIISVLNYAFMAFDKNLYALLISNKRILKSTYIVITLIGLIMFYNKVLPDWIKEYNYIVNSKK